jgi:HD-GYP domain-containing protein (c-di-GMP phosphodiesterase class II)
MDVDYQAVTLNSLKDSFKDLTFDLYLLMPTGKYLKAFDHATGLDFSRLASYEAKGVRHFYVRREDFPRLDEHLARSPMLTLTNPAYPFEKRKKAFLVVMEQSLFEAFSQGTPSQMNVSRTFEALKQSLQGDRDFLDTLSLLLEVCPRDDQFLKHSIQTSIYSYIVASLNGMTSERSLKIILFAAFFHDIGRLKLPEGRRIAYENKSIEEIIEFRRHPILTLETFPDSFPFADEEIRTTILQHKERLDGKGYPHGVKGTSVFSLARIVAIGDALSELNLGMEDGHFYSKAQALAHMMADEGHYDKKLLSPFAQVILQGVYPKVA